MQKLPVPRAISGHLVLSSGDAKQHEKDHNHKATTAARKRLVRLVGGLEPIEPKFLVNWTGKSSFPKGVGFMFLSSYEAPPRKGLASRHRFGDLLELFFGSNKVIALHVDLTRCSRLLLGPARLHPQGLVKNPIKFLGPLFRGLTSSGLEVNPFYTKQAKGQSTATKPGSETSKSDLQQLGL